MIKIFLKRREESDTFLTHAVDIAGAIKSPVKIDEIGAFSQHCGFHQL
jgi:hypothetical protein